MGVIIQLYNEKTQYMANTLDLFMQFTVCKPHVVLRNDTQREHHEPIRLIVDEHIENETVITKKQF